MIGINIGITYLIVGFMWAVFAVVQHYRRGYPLVGIGPCLVLNTFLWPYAFYLFLTKYGGEVK